MVSSVECLVELGFVLQKSCNAQESQQPPIARSECWTRRECYTWRRQWSGASNSAVCVVWRYSYPWPWRSLNFESWFSKCFDSRSVATETNQKGATRLGHWLRIVMHSVVDISVLFFFSLSSCVFLLPTFFSSNFQHFIFLFLFSATRHYIPGDCNSHRQSCEIF
jgi:hypothetical protein